MTFKTHCRYYILLTQVILLSVTSAFAQLDLNEKIPVDPTIKVGKLSNGLTYYIRKNSRPEKKVELRLVVNTGSILEDDDQQGLAHFTEHMAFNGTKNFKKNDLVSFLQSIGVKFGADLNAYTSFDETVYILPVPTDKPELVEKSFQILEDWASAVTFDNAEIDKERGVVLEESRLGKGADDRMDKITYPKIFAGSRYANRLPIGQESVLKNFKYDVIKRFYRDWYRPDLMAVVVVGDIDPTAAEGLVKKHFEKLKNPAKPRARTYAEIPARTATEGVVATDKEATNPIIQIYYSNTKSKPEVTLSDYRTSLIRALCTSMLGQRLQELTQKADPPFVFGFSSLGSFVRGYEGYSSGALVSKGGAEPTITALIQENERARKFGFTEAELDRTKKTMLKNIERSYNEREKTESAGLANEFIRNFLTQEPIPGISNEYKYYNEFLKTITLAEVNQATAKIIPPSSDSKLIIFTGPIENQFKVPTKEELVAIAENAAKAEIKPYEEKMVASTLMEAKPAPGAIKQEKEIPGIGVTEITFANGVKVLLKPTDFKNDQVIMSSSRFGGQYLYDPKERANAEYAAMVVGQMGVAEFSPTDLRKVLAGKTASATPRITQLSEGINGQSGAADIETMLQLTHLYFTKPRIDTELFNSFVTKQQALYQNAMSDPQFIFQDSVLRILYKNHPWAPRLPKVETFNTIDKERAVQIYKERFGNANGFTFVFVGKFDVASIKPLLATYLGSLPSTGAASTFKDVGLRSAKGPLKKEVKKGTEPKSMIRLYWNGETTFSEEEQFKLQALAEVMNIKIIETLREDLSGIYGGGMSANLSKNPYGNYSIAVMLPCGPENVDKLVAATIGEIEKVRTNGPTEADLQKVKETWKQQYLVNVKDNSYWSRILLQSVEIGSNPASVLEYEKRVDALTAKQVQDAAKKYLDTKNFIQIVLNPELSEQIQTK
ncbi:MAG TPA: insulinase family protein [Chryseosolibacter sp.]